VNQPRYSRRAAAALILSPDPLAGALLGAAVEVAGFRAEFARSDESLRASLTRVRPSHVLIDCDDPNSRDESALGPALMTGVRLFFFGSAPKTNDLIAIASRYQARLVVLPDDVDRLHDILTRRPSPTRELSPR
jgi:hypothetical protein